MKTLKVIFAALSLLVLCSFIKDTDEQVGFYVNNGKTRITELSCFDFDNLCIRHMVTREMLGYDLLEYTISFTGKEENSRELEIKGQVFKSKNRVGELATVWVFKDSDTRAESEFEDYNDGALTRSSLQYTDKNSAKDIQVSVSLRGATISGYEEKWDAGSSSYKKRPTYDYSKLFETKNVLTIKNRIKNKYRVFQFIPGLNFFLGSKPNDVVKTGNCFPANKAATTDQK